MLCFDVLFSMRNRPTRDQRLYYNRHKRKHAIKFQGVVTPDGIVVDFFGSELGARHDVHLLNESGLSSTNFRFPRLAQKLEPYVCYQLLGLSMKRAHSCYSPRNPRRDTSEERKKLRPSHPPYTGYSFNSCVHFP